MMEKKSTHSNTRKDRVEEIDVEHLTFSDISPRYGTGQAITHGSGRGDVTQEQINQSNGCVHCPICGRWSEFRIVSPSSEKTGNQERRQ